MNTAIVFLMIGFGYLPIILIGLMIDLYRDVRDIIYDYKCGKSVGLSILTHSITFVFILGVLTPILLFI